MKIHWNSLWRNLSIWIAFFFLCSFIPLFFIWLEIGDFSIAFGGKALDEGGGSPFWNQYFFELALHYQGYIVFGTIAWAFYKVIVLPRNNYKSQVLFKSN